MHEIIENNLYKTPESILEFIYEISEKWKDEDDPIESMKSDLLTMIRFFKEKKFNKFLEDFGMDYDP